MADPASRISGMQSRKSLPLVSILNIVPRLGQNVGGR
ncbi:hypothetical protein BN381_710004 [Candidatus Microthrix parvicella RN1]|uniref:Uncharacterized protein n=1 Tax=Candidatus Neomicrothrix parvicella RN1 TaxID=1229780 RepID=R4Z436_9ACTN|nr:hypothetical protein BN381_710004 [Candidatus Microthrix parvicella RN1]